MDVKSFNWQVVNFYGGALVRWAVPVFVMISGALFLSKDIPVKKLYTKYILKIAVVFAFWSFIYSINDYVKTGEMLTIWENLICGHYHLWFLFMIVGLYMIVPFMKKISESESLTRYFLVLAVIFTFILPKAPKAASIFSEVYGKILRKFIGQFFMSFVGGFSGYFMLGHFLDRTNLPRKYEKLIYLAGVLGLSMTVLMSASVSLFGNKPYAFYDNMSVNIMLESAAIFVFFKTRFTHENRIIRKLSAYSFGAYLVHPAVIALLRKLGLHSLTFTPVLAVPVVSVIVFVLSFTISAVLNHVPVLKKYAV